MDWVQLLSIKRFGLEDYHSEKKQERTEYQRDYDRLIFRRPSVVCKTKHRSFPCREVFLYTTDLPIAWKFQALDVRLAKSLDANCGKNIHNRRLISKKLPPLFRLPAWHTIWAIPHSDTRAKRPYRLFFRKEKAANCNPK